MVVRGVEAIVCGLVAGVVDTTARLWSVVTTVYVHAAVRYSTAFRLIRWCESNGSRVNRSGGTLSGNLRAAVFRSSVLRLRGVDLHQYCIGHMIELLQSSLDRFEVMLLDPVLDEIVGTCEHEKAIAHCLRLKQGEESVDLGRVKVVIRFYTSAYLVPFFIEQIAVHVFLREPRCSGVLST